MIDPSKVCLFIPAALKVGGTKWNLFDRIGKKIQAHGGRIALHDPAILDALPNDIIPIVGCQPESTALIKKWQANKRDWIYWDRGYARRVYATWLPRASTMELSYYRWHLNSYQMQEIYNVPGDRWEALDQPLTPWSKNPNGHIELACGSITYDTFHDIVGWKERTLEELCKHTLRPIYTSDKETKVSLADRIKGAHALVTHGSNAAVEAAIMGCPVFVSPESAAALVGQTDLSKIEEPVFPDRTAWANSLAYCQFNEHELVDGTLWNMMR